MNISGQDLIRACSAIGAGLAVIAGIGPGTVSYTHLDVYKRQEQYIEYKEQTPIWRIWCLCDADPACDYFVVYIYQQQYNQ